MNTPIVILCGGLGTRLRSVVSDRPKPLALINGRPFLDILLKKILSFDVPKIYLSVGYKADYFRKYLQEYGLSKKIQLIEEPTKLGTGGAVNFAFKFINTESLIILNGDSFCDIDLREIENIGSKFRSSVIAVNSVEDTSRYGRVELNERKSHVYDFKEKGLHGRGLINTGVYYLLKSDILDEETYSLEEEVLAPLSREHKLRAYISNSEFIDIGIPSDYEKAQSFFRGI